MRDDVDPCEHLYIGGCPHCAAASTQPATKRSADVVNALDMSRALIERLRKQPHGSETLDMLVWLRRLLDEATR